MPRWLLFERSLLYLCFFEDLERQWAPPVTILWLPLLSGFAGGWRQRGRQIKYLIPFIRQDINRSTVFQQRFQSPFPWSAAAQYQYHHPTPSINFHHLGHRRSSWWDGTWLSTSTTVPKVISTVAAQYQYWASNEINQMLMDPNNEIGINANIAAIVFSFAHLNPPVVESRSK